MQRTRALHALHGSFLGQVTAAIDLTDILRAEVVLAVSALDYFVHELTRMGMIECWSGEGFKQTHSFDTNSHICRPRPRESWNCTADVRFGDPR